VSAFAGIRFERERASAIPLLKSKRLLSVPNRHLSYLVTSCGLRAMEGRMEIPPENIKEALDLSMAFEICSAPSDRRSSPMLRCKNSKRRLTS
jgi:hypothetical protein